MNAVNRMVEAEVEGVEFLAVNTDQQSLQQSTADITLHIGAELTRGLGSGSDAAVGRQAAMEDYDRVKALLKGSDMIFITAGAGGGTGTGAAPIVARIAREVGALTVAIVTKPFGFEGSRRSEQAETGIAALAEEVDTLIVVPNNRLLTVLDKQTAMVEAFRVADDVLRQGVQGISDLVTLPGLINLDFADVRTIMSDAGNALLGIGMGVGGESRAVDAAMQAVASPLLETSMDGAHSILLSITGGRDLSLWEVNEAAKAVSEAAHPDANIIFGAMVDEKLDDQVWVTVVATGYGDARRQIARDLGTRAVCASPPASPACAAPAAGLRARLMHRAGRRSRWTRWTYPSSCPASDGRVSASPCCVLRSLACRARQALTRVLWPGSTDATVRSVVALLVLRATSRALWYRSDMSDTAEHGVIAAGHPLTAQAGAEVLRAGGNAVDAAVGAMLMSFAAEPLLTGLGAGGHMLVAGAGEEPVLLDFFVQAPARRQDGGAAELDAVDVSFGDAVQVFHIGPASCGVYGTPAGVCAAVERWGTMSLERLTAPAARARARGREAERRPGVHREDPRRPAHLHARVRRAVGARGPRAARGRAAAQPRPRRRPRPAGR